MNCGGTGLVGYSDSSEEESGEGEEKDGDDKSPPQKKHRGGSDSRCAHIYGVLNFTVKVNCLQLGSRKLQRSPI